MSKENNYRAYMFRFTDSRSVIQSREHMEKVFERTEILEYLIHGHPLFKKEELDNDNGIIKVDFSEYVSLYSYDFTTWIQAILDLREVDESIIMNGFVIGSSLYLENKYRKKMEEEKAETRIDRSKINSPSDDIDEIYSWQQILIVSADQELIMTKIQEKENNGYTLVNNNLIRQSGVSSYPLSLVFRKRKEENNN